MRELHRVTTEYVDIEDRVRLVGEDREGRIQTLWLTRRMLDRLVPHLTLWLESHHAALPRPEILHEFAQQKARDALTPQAPVAAGITEDGWLVREVDVSPGAEQLQLGFKQQQDEVVVIRFSPILLRQWLAILDSAFVRGDWPRTAWPAWMTESPMAAQGTSPTVWH